MNEITDLSEERQKVADSVAGVSDMSEDFNGLESGNGGEVAKPRRPEKTSSDSAFAKMRRELIFLKLELSRKEGEINELRGYLSQSGPRESMAMAQEISRFRKAEARRRMEKDLEAVRRFEPNLQSLDELGEDFLRLVKNGIDGESAYLAIKSRNNEAVRKAPPAIGRVNSNTYTERDYYTSDELDRLTSDELNNPTIYERALKSLTKLN